MPDITPAAGGPPAPKPQPPGGAGGGGGEGGGGTFLDRVLSKLDSISQRQDAMERRLAGGRGDDGDLTMQHEGPAEITHKGPPAPPAGGQPPPVAPPSGPPQGAGGGGQGGGGMPPFLDSARADSSKKADDDDKKDSAKKDSKSKADGKAKADDDDDDRKDSKSKADGKAKADDDDDDDRKDSSKADGKKSDSKKADDDDDDRKDSKKDSKADAKADSMGYNDLKARLDALERRGAPMTEDVAQKFAEAQMRADSVFQGFGKRAPAALEGESLIGYRKRLAGQLKHHSKTWGAKDVNFSELPEPAFRIAEDAVYADATEAAAHPTDLAAGEFRRVLKVDPDTGQRRIEYQGNESFIKGFSRSGRHIAFNTQRRQAS